MPSQFIPAVRVPLAPRPSHRPGPSHGNSAWPRWLRRTLLRSRQVRRLLRHRGA